jgi:hypothetical protein
MSIHDDEVDFLDDVLVAQLMKEVVDPLRERLFERVI